MKELSLGFSPCPNDTFIFYALTHRLIHTEDLRFKEVLLDVETLNERALKKGFDIAKVSYHAFAFLREDYCLLNSGSALGRGCGPLIVAKEQFSIDDLRGKKVAIPGRLTTAYLLLKLYDTQLSENIEVMRFNKIMNAVKRGVVSAGLVIHEARFTYHKYGLKCILDLGEWWDEKTGLPIPLGGIIAKRALGKDLIQKIEQLIRKSLLYAIQNPEEPMKYIKRHSQELSEPVIQKHIRLYVNDYSLNLKDEGLKAISLLLSMAEKKGIIKKTT